MLEHVWIIPAIPFASFWLILLIGKRLGEKGTQAIGITALAVAFVLSCVTGAQWIDRAEAVEDGRYEPTVVVTDGDRVEEEPDAISHGGHGVPRRGAWSDHVGRARRPTRVPSVDPATPTDGGEAPPHRCRAESAGTAAASGQETAAAAEGAEDAEGAAGPVIQRVTWFQWGGTEFYAGTMLDGLAAMMLFTVTLISLLVHVYSTEYLHGDRRHTHYFAFLSLFTASMLAFVVSENILQMLVGWELVGVCSFVLIGHWWEEKKNSDAALKAFLTNRVGDMGLIVGVIIVFFAVGGQFSILDINETVLSGEVSHTLMLAAARASFVGVTSKSGQFPLHTWLPDAMAGSHSGLGADPRRDHGRRRRLPHRPALPGVLRGPVDRHRQHQLHRVHRRAHDPRRRVPRLRAERHQEGVGVLHDLPARLHGHGARCRRLDGGDVPRLHPRLLQGRALPGRRVGQPRGPSHLRHARDGWAPQVHAPDLHDLRHLLGGARRASSRSRASGPRTRSSPTRRAARSVGPTPSC
ncbi:MAG: proton-conducting transporter membrane subunit [Acidimicrobiia bacterium]|nr:proton-conducting transporter membrane subunit [Acidimicrobiia bacterium]